MSEAKGWMEDRICDECKKHISVLYPDLWQYKRKEGQGRKATYWCSWKCMRASEKKEEAKKEMRKLTLDNKKRAVEIAVNGGNPMEYLERLGIKDAGGAWMRIKAEAIKADPELLKSIPDRRCKKPEPAKAEVTIMDKVPEVKMDGAIRIETKEPGKVKVETILEKINREYSEKEAKITKQLCYDGMSVAAVIGELGRYSRVDIKGVTYIDFDGVEGDAISMTAENWKVFMKEFRKAAMIMGVDVDDEA